MPEPKPSTADRADRLQRRRMRVMFVQGAFFLILQANYFTIDRPAQALRTVDHVRLSATVVLSAVLLLLLATGGGWWKGREVRALMNDETTRAHRAQALMLGFWVVMAVTLVLYVLAQVSPIPLLDALHLVLSFGIGASLLRFAQLERRALRHG